MIGFFAQVIQDFYNQKFSKSLTNPTNRPRGTKEEQIQKWSKKRSV